MTEPNQKKKFKQPPKRFHPRGMEVLYEDHDIVVVDKSSGLLTMGNDKEKVMTAYFMLTDYVKKGNPKSKKRIFIVHRLDRDTSGVLVFAKTPEAKHYLQEEWHDFSKVYYAVVRGAPPEQEGVVSSYLAENQAHVVYSVDDPAKGKLAKTGYKVIQQNRRYSLLEIQLHTGRKNQIRVHLADIGCSVVGDKKYGEKGKDGKRLALHAARLKIRHPHSKEDMTFEAEIPPFFSGLMGPG